MSSPQACAYLLTYSPTYLCAVLGPVQKVLHHVNFLLRTARRVLGLGDAVSTHALLGCVGVGACFAAYEGVMHGLSAAEAALTPRDKKAEKKADR